MTDGTLCSATGAGRVNHEVDYFLADAAVLQVDDLGCRQAIHRLGIADVAEDDFVTEAGFCQRFYIGHANRLTLATALDWRRLGQ